MHPMHTDLDRVRQLGRMPYAPRTTILDSQIANPMPMGQTRVAREATPPSTLAGHPGKSHYGGSKVLSSIANGEDWDRHPTYASFNCGIIEPCDPCTRDYRLRQPGRA